MAKTERKAIDKVLILLGVVTTLFLLVFGALAWYGYDFATSNVREQLAAQKIYFPPKGSAALDPAKYPGLQQYAGQLVDDGLKAKAYANEYIGKHLEEVAGGKTYAEVSTEARKDPSNQTLQAQRRALLDGELLRAALLGSGYAYWTFGMLAKYVAIISLIGAGIMAVLVWLGWIHLARLR
jgi:hypothetical protein